VRRDSGQALVELALALPLLLLILVGIFEFARAYSIKQSLVNAAREGARTAVLPNISTEDTILKVVNNYLSANNIIADDIVIRGAADTKDIGAIVTGEDVTVTVIDRYDFILLGPVISLFGGTFRDGVNLGSRATMRKE
jgi:Flp pilus assembly protein TadG